MLLILMIRWSHKRSFRILFYDSSKTQAPIHQILPCVERRECSYVGSHLKAHRSPQKGNPFPHALRKV